MNPVHSYRHVLWWSGDLKEATFRRAVQRNRINLNTRRYARKFEGTGSTERANQILSEDLG